MWLLLAAVGAARAEAHPASPPTAETPPANTANPGERGAAADDEAGWDDPGADEAGWGGGADDAGWGEGADDLGFSATNQDPPAASPEGARAWTTGGALRLDAAAWTRPTPTLAKGRVTITTFAAWSQGDLRARVAGRAELDPVALNHPDYDAPSRALYGGRLILEEASLSGVEGAFDAAIGWQRLSFGEAVVLSALDVASPRDLREPGLGDPELLRLPLFAITSGWTRGAHRVVGIVAPEARFGLRSPPSGPFGPLPGLIGADPALTAIVGERAFAWEEEPGFALDHAQAHLRWTFRGSGLDLGAQASLALDQQGVLSLPSLTALFADDPVRIPLDHRRYGLLGQTGALAAGPAVLRWELALALGKPVNTGDLAGLFPSIDTARANVATAVVGAQWAVGGWQLLAEASRSQGIAAPADTLFPVNLTSAAGRAGWRSARERWSFDALALKFLGDRGGLLRADLGWRPADGARFTLGYARFDDGEEIGPFVGLMQHDRVTAGVLYGW